jgi:hypothetical protein
MKMGKRVSSGTGLKVATALKAGKLSSNHNRTEVLRLRAKTALKAGRLSANHNCVLR